MRSSDLSESPWFFLLLLGILVAEQALAVHLSFHLRGNEALAPAQAAPRLAIYPNLVIPALIHDTGLGPTNPNQAATKAAAVQATPGGSQQKPAAASKSARCTSVSSPPQPSKWKT